MVARRRRHGGASIGDGRGVGEREQSWRLRVEEAVGVGFVRGGYLKEWKSIEWLCCPELSNPSISSCLPILQNSLYINFENWEEHGKKEVLIHEKQCVRKIVLNRPKQLNALSSYMVHCLLDLFLEYEEDPGVKMILLKGSGRAFCAGGDVAAVVNDISKGDWRSGADYFRKEFTLNYVIATYRKPQVSILNGIVMGGGAGASIHGKFRVVTENTVYLDLLLACFYFCQYSIVSITSNKESQ
ncbi:hypothetical protein KSS87_001817 [Heliosperma pusillum]|nr:hypothetical protein KSS87_001817 [Heliosperma pusillum]